MNLHGFQSALAHVLRSYGQPTFPTIDELTRRYDLKEPELFQLQHVLRQNGLKAYGEELSHARWYTINQGLSFLFPVIDEEVIGELWDIFEPHCFNILQDELSASFLKYLTTDKYAIERLQKSEVPYAHALLSYAYCVFIMRSLSPLRLTVAEESLLSGRFFMVQDLSYDVRQLFSMLVDKKSVESIVPQAKNMTILFIASDEIMEFRSFEIDEEIKEFLTAEREGKITRKKLPACMDDLCLLGLCKKR